MALPSPRLDDRGYQELVDDAKRHVMRRCPEWTDHNLADPGVTLIETFAYMTDQLIYRLNRVPDRMYVKFLDLIGLRLIAPTAACAPVTFWLSAPPDEAFLIPAGTRASTFRTDTEDPIVFSTNTDLELVPCSLTAMATQRAFRSDDALDSQRGPVDCTRELEFSTPVTAFSFPPRPGDELLLGLDRAAPSCVVRIDYTGQVSGVGVNPKRPPLVWEAATQEGWEPCEVDDDATGGLNADGAIVVHVPPTHENTILLGMARGWLRARVVEPEDGQPGYSASPIVHQMRAATVGGTVTASHAEIVADETVGEAEGVAGARFALARSPVLAESAVLRVEVSSADGWREWSVVEHFGESGPDDRHVTLDAFTGELSFGPLVRQPDGTVRQFGAVPGKGEVVRVTYAVGGGRAGNVTAGAIRTLRSSIPYVTSVENRCSAQGGRDAETLDEAKARGPLMLRSRSRAVTAEDYEVLARAAAPEVARVRAVAADGDGVPGGTVKILVVPAAPNMGGRVRLEDLIPADETLARMAAELDRSRVLGTRVHLEPPRYRGVTVVARLLSRASADAGRVRDDALDALYTLLNPLPGGGPDGAGWPFGRPVQQGELHAVLSRVRGVELVEEVRLFGADPVSGRRGNEVSRIDVDKHSLVISFEHHVRVESA
jgi:predicted phage baseplate assembly protein